MDFNGKKRNWLNSYQKNALSQKDKSKYNTIVWVANTSALIASAVVVYIVKKQGGSFWKQIGFGLGTAAAGYGIGYLATKSYSDKLGTSTGISSDSMVAMNEANRAELERLAAS
jgi:hypothetical protein